MIVKDIMKPRVPVVGNGSYIAVCVGVIAVGEQLVDRKAFGKGEQYEYHVVFVWDIPAQRDADGKPKQISKEVNVAGGPTATLNKILSAWNRRPYTASECLASDLEDQLGQPCMLTVEVSESGFANVKSVAAIPDGVTVPDTDTPFIVFDVNQWDDGKFETLPDWVKKKIEKSTQYQKAHPPTTVVDFQANMAAQVPQSAAPALQPAQPVQQAAPPVQQQAAPQAQQSAYAAPAAPGAVNQQAYQIPYQGAAQSVPVAQHQQPIAQQGANNGVPF